MANEDIGSTWGTSTTTTIYTGGVPGGSSPTPTGPVGPGTGTGTSDGTVYYESPFKLISEWISNYDPDSIGSIGTTDDGKKWKFTFNCKFYYKKIINTLSTDTTIYIPKKINSIKLGLYEIIKDVNGNFINIPADGKQWSSKDYPALKEVGKKLPLNHTLYSLADDTGTYKEVCTWTITTNQTIGSVDANNFYFNNYSFDIDYKLSLKYSDTTYKPVINTTNGYNTNSTLQKNKHYFVKVLPIEYYENESSSYLTLNSNDLIDTSGNLYETNLNTTFRFQNIDWYNNYRAGESLLTINCQIESRNTGITDPSSSTYNYKTDKYIIKNTIDNSKFFDTYVDPFLNLSNNKYPWSLIVKINSGNSFSYPTEIYYSKLAWIKTPLNDYVSQTYTLKKTDIKNWVDPTPDSNNIGYWYQIWDSWEYNTSTKLISVRQKDTDDLPVSENTNGFGGHYSSNLEEYEGYMISYPIHYYFNYIFEKDYNYQFVVLAKNLAKGGDVVDLKLTTPWMDKVMLRVDNTINTEHFINYNIYSNINSFSNLNKQVFDTNDLISKRGLTNEYNIKLPEIKPIKRVVSKKNPQNPITISANTNFNNGKGIDKIVIYKTKWFIQSYAAYTDFENNNLKATTSSSGWHLIIDKGIFLFYNKKDDPDYPFIADIEDYFSKKYYYEEYRVDNKYYNFICRYIKVQNFNLSFDYTNNSNNLKIEIYTGIFLPRDPYNIFNNGYTIEYLLENNLIQKIGTIGKSKSSSSQSPDGDKQYCEFIGLTGNQYLIFIVTGVKNETEFLRIENLKIEGEYHPLNNTLFKDLNDSYQSSQNFSPSFNIKLGSGNNVDPNAVNDIYIINSKIGNSNFQSGIWETGVWQSGWRDSKQYAFIDVDQFFSYDNDRIWRFIISGNIEISNYDLNIGDKISISNIVAIDINGDRRLIKNYFTISEIFGKSIVVEFIYDFPIKSIEKDSENHLIMVTKSIWLHGIFLNGRFKGNWIDGVFKGYPFITKMEESHWVDGEFSGGHFKSDVIKYTINNIDSQLDDVYIVIETKEDNQLQNGGIFYLPNENREFKVLSIINSKSFYSDIRKDDNIIINTNMIISTSKNSGLIQNIDFNSDNTSDKTISKSFVSEYVFSYNSWLDLVYDNSSATNIFKSQNIPDNVGGFYSENNLYGYITKDILSSVSRFRDSYSINVREYKLGTKWKIFYDYIGDSSTFDEYFHSIYTPKKTLEMGWSFNISKNELPKISRFIGYRTDDKNDDITGKELKLVAEGDGGILNLDNRSITNIPFRYTEKIKPNGYSFVSFDLINKEIDSSKYQKGDISSTNEKITWYNGTYSIVDDSSIFEPIFSFSNINQTNIVRNGKTYNTAMSYLPISENINHLETPNKTKIEYFFNKRDLMLSLKGSGYYGLGTASIVIDNLKFYETDMIPFFQYFTMDNINKGVQIPNGIDYVKFNYDTNINYNYVSYTSNKTYNYFDVDRFKSETLINDSFWLKDNSLNSININDFFNRSI